MWGVNYADVTEVHFCEKGTIVTVKIYLDALIKLRGKPFIVELFNGHEWTFQ